MPAPDEVLTITPPPCFSIWASSCFMQTNVPRRFMPRMRSHSSISISASGAALFSTPALLNAQSMRPKISTVRATAASPSSVFYTSQLIAATSAPAAFTCSAVSWSAASLRSVTATRAPSAANAIAVARPIPLAAPVIKAVLSSKRFKLAIVVISHLVQLPWLVGDVGPIHFLGPVPRRYILDADRHGIIAIAQGLDDRLGDFIGERPLLRLGAARVHFHDAIWHGIPRASGLDHHFNGLAAVHRAIAFGHTIETDHAVEDPSGLDAACEDIGQQLLDVGAHGCGSAADDDVLVEERLRRRDDVVVRDADASDRAAGAGNTHGSSHGLVRPDAFKHRVGSEPVRQIANPGNAFLAALADDVGRAKILRQGEPVRMAAEHDDPLGTEALGGDHPAEAYRAIADHGGGHAGRHPSHSGGVVAGAHDVGKRQQRRHERVVLGNIDGEQRPVGIRDAQRFCLGAVEAAIAEEAAMDAGRLQTLMAEGTGAVRMREGHDDEIADLQRLHIRADGFDDPDRLVAHRLAV